MSVQYVIKHGKIEGIDYDNNGVIDDNDVIVVKLVNGVEVDRQLLNQKTQNAIQNVIKNEDPADNHNVRVVYTNMPPANAANPPPVVIKDETTFGQYVKAGAGIAVGQVAVRSVFEILASLFTSEGGGVRRRRRVPKTKITKN